MTRILYWNLQNFTENKIESRGNVTAQAAAAKRLEYILSVVSHQLDVIVFVEVFARDVGDSKSGTVLPPGRGPAKGLFTLVQAIRDTTGAHWCLVPPIISGTGGKCEGVAVFYNSANLTFRGPCVYADDDGLHQSVTVRRWLDDALELAFYPNPYLNYITEREWDVGGNDLRESQCAGQVKFADLEKLDEHNRAPFLVRMLDSGGRFINIFAVHTSPLNAVTQVERISGMRALHEIGNNSVNVVVGDFNVDPFFPIGNAAKVFPLDAVQNPYSQLRDSLGYTMLIDPCGPLGPGGKPTANAPNKICQPYCLTHLLPNFRTGNAIATPLNCDVSPPGPQHNVYPRLGYMGGVEFGGALSDRGALDNAFVKYGASLGAVAHNTTIINPVVGSPYNAKPAPAAAVDLVGHIAQPSLLTQKIPAGGSPGGDTGWFNDWDNYGHIYSTSDHLPLVFDV